MTASFFSTLNFGSSNEDGASEVAALALGPKDRVLALTASGSRVFDLMCDPVGQICALDLNPAQNALLALRCAALTTLDDAAYAAFLGYGPAQDRWVTFQRVRRALSPPYQSLWDGQRQALTTGIIWRGRWERILAWAALASGLTLPRDTLFHASDLPAQKAIWDAKFGRGLWRWSLGQLCRPFIWTHVMGEPGGAFIQDRQKIAQKIADRFAQAANRVLFARSEFMNLLFYGPRAPFVLPYHMRQGRLGQVRENLDRLTVHQGGLANLPCLFGQKFDAFSLSDFGSYCEGDAYAACWDAVRACAKPGARFAERRFLTNQPLPDGTDLALSKTLSQKDSAVIYDILTGVVTSSNTKGQKS